MGFWTHGETLAVLVVAREVVQRQKHGGAEFRHGGALREQRGGDPTISPMISGARSARERTERRKESAD